MARSPASLRPPGAPSAPPRTRSTHARGPTTVGGSLVHLLAACNAGEGRGAGWLGKELAGTQDDPLLFIEGVPLAETRGYIKKVLSSLWAYQANLGQRSPSL